MEDMDVRQDHGKRPLTTEAEREKRAREWADRIPEDENEAGPVRETYRDGGLITECWSGGISSGETEKP